MLKHTDQAFQGGQKDDAPMVVLVNFGWLTCGQCLASIIRDVHVHGLHVSSLMAVFQSRRPNSSIHP